MLTPHFFTQCTPLARIRVVLLLLPPLPLSAEIIWENLELTRGVRFMRRLAVNVLLLSFLLISFVFIITVRVLAVQRHS